MMFAQTVPGPIRNAIGWIAAALLLLAGSAVMLPAGDLHALGTVPTFLGGAAIMLAGFFLGIRVREMPLLAFWTVPLVARIMLLWQVPGGDIYRYIWEGRMLGTGINPYLHPPASDALIPYRDAVWASVQHAEFTAIYPPIAEWIFAAIAFFTLSPFWFKAVFLIADAGIAALLGREFGSRSAGVYWWNPLVIYSFAGGGHYDSIFLLALVGGWILWRNQRWIASAGAVGFAIALKWLALPVFGWMVWTRMRDRRFVSAALVLGLGLLPMALAWSAIGLWTGEWTTQLLPEKFSEHARSAEFLPGIATYLNPAELYTNSWILAPLAAAWAVVILVAKRFESAAETLFFVTLIASPLVHGWYFTWLIPFACATRNLGTLAVSASAFVYFMLYHHVERPGGMWVLSPFETGALWLPLVFGFAWTLWKRHPSKP